MKVKNPMTQIGVNLINSAAWGFFLSGMSLFDKLNVFSGYCIQCLEKRTVIFETRRLPREESQWELWWICQGTLSSLSLELQIDLRVAKLRKIQVHVRIFWGSNSVCTMAKLYSAVGIGWNGEIFGTRHVHIKKVSFHKSDCLLSSFLTSLVFWEICCVLLLCCKMDLGIWDTAFFFFLICLLIECSSRSLPSSLGINEGTAIGSSCH